MVTGSSTAVTIRAALASARSSGTSCPSPKPLAMDTDALPDAIAFAPDLATASALPASHALNSTSGSPATWSFAKSSNLLMAESVSLGSRSFGAAARSRLLESCAQHPSSAYRTARHFLELRHQRAMRERAVADARDSGARPHPLVRRAGEGDHIQRQRDLADHALDVRRVGQARHEEAARAGGGERLPALDHLIDGRVAVVLRLEQGVGTGVDEELIADRAADRGDSAGLKVERVEALAADHLVLEVAADRAGRGEPDDIGRALTGVG